MCVSEYLYHLLTLAEAHSADPGGLWLPVAFCCHLYLFSHISQTIVRLVSSPFHCCKPYLWLLYRICSFGMRMFSSPSGWCYLLSFCHSPSSRGDFCSWTFPSFLMSVILSATLIPLRIKILTSQIVHPWILYLQ